MAAALSGKESFYFLFTTAQLRLLSNFLAELVEDVWLGAKQVKALRCENIRRQRQRRRGDRFLLLWSRLFFSLAKNVVVVARESLRVAPPVICWLEGYIRGVQAIRATAAAAAAVAAAAAAAVAAAAAAAGAATAATRSTRAGAATAAAATTTGRAAAAAALDGKTTAHRRKTMILRTQNAELRPQRRAEGRHGRKHTAVLWWNHSMDRHALAGPVPSSNFGDRTGLEWSGKKNVVYSVV